MCDTFLALPGGAASRVVLFAKNSDRQRNEAQAVEYFPREQFASGATQVCTYVAIPQARRKHATLLCRPYWIWGAEMGANEHGVVIGNEGLQASVAAPEEKALIGMDLLRLGLERGATAAEALEVITSLLREYGQGGNCGHITPSFYHNSFLIADTSDAFVLETVGREWVSQRVCDSRAISNDYSIGSDIDRASDGMRALWRKCGWNGEAMPNSAALLTDPERAHIGSASGRRSRATALLRAAGSDIRLLQVFSVLRDHDPEGEASPHWEPDQPHRYSLCIHAGTEDRFSQTTGSMASQLRDGDAVHWVTGTSAPCLSIFKPVLLDVPLPRHGLSPSASFDAQCLWWRHERLHRAVLRTGFSRFLASIREECDALEARFEQHIEGVMNGGSRDDRARVVEECWSEAAALEARWWNRIAREQLAANAASPSQATWRAASRLAEIPE